MKSVRLIKYIELILSFLHGRISPLDFEQAYLALYLNDETEWSEPEFAVLDELFGAVDAFCADAKLRDKNDLDEDELRLACKIALGRLKVLKVL